MIAEIYLIAVITSLACALPGVFLVLKKMAMISDSITHTVLLGIVLAFFVAQDFGSPLLLVGASLVGIATVWLTESAHRTRLMSEESSIGIIYPLLFSVAVILISLYGSQTHLDRDTVFLGELGFAPFNRLEFFGIDLGPKALYSMGIILIINAALITIFFKELKVGAFDAMFAGLSGFMPVLLHYAVMTSVSVTAVGAFETAGSVLSVSLMISAPATARLVSGDLKRMIIYTVMFSVLNALLGTTAAFVFDVSAAGSIAACSGATFLAVLAFAPRKGLLAKWLSRRNQKEYFLSVTMLYHIYHHQHQKDSHIESGITTISEHLNLEPKTERRIIDRHLEKKRLKIYRNTLILTDEGKKYLKKASRDLFY